MKFFEESDAMQRFDRMETDVAAAQALAKGMTAQDAAVKKNDDPDPARVPEATPTPEMNVWPVIPAYPGPDANQMPGMNTRPIILPGMDTDPNPNETPGMNTRPIIVPGMGGQQPGMGTPQQPETGKPQRPGMGTPQQPETGRPQRPGMGRPQQPESGMPQRPGIGRPEQPGGRPPVVIGTVITAYPRPNEPCRFCRPNDQRYATVRFLNATAGYFPFTVYVDENIMIRNLQHAEISAYEKVNSGSHTITLVGPENYVYFQKGIEIPEGDVVTVAIVNARSGLELFAVSDEVCPERSGTGCIRAVNLSPVSGAVNVTVEDQENQEVSFINLQYQNVADYQRIRPGRYRYFVTRNMFRALPGAGSGVVLASAVLDVRAGSSVTIYIFNWNQDQPNAIRTLVVEERR